MPTPKIISTHPYPRCRLVCRKTRIAVMMETNGRTIGRKNFHPYGFTSSMSSPSEDSRVYSCGPMKRR